jgi:hypothetical protein
MIIKIFDKLYKNYIEENESKLKKKEKINSYKNKNKNNYKNINTNIFRYNLLKIK